MEKEKKPIYKKWWFWLLIVIVIAGIVSVGGGDSNTTKQTSSNPTTNTTNSSNKNEKTEYNKGEEAILGDSAIIVTKVEKSQGSQWDKPSSGKEYVIVSISIENKGKKNITYNPYDFKIQNSQGQQENITFTTIDNDTALHTGELIPGGKINGTVTFEQPKGDEGLVLIYNNNIWSSKELKIKL